MTAIGTVHGGGDGEASRLEAKGVDAIGMVATEGWTVMEVGA